VQLIRDFSQQGNKSVLLTSHILANLEKICTHLLVLDHTRIVLNEPIDFFRSENQSLEPYVLSILKGETAPKQAVWN
jgi:ABC-type multidrug transport system ATPase subunit